MKNDKLTKNIKFQMLFQQVRSTYGMDAEEAFKQHITGGILQKGALGLSMDALKAKMMATGILPTEEEEQEMMRQQQQQPQIQQTPVVQPAAQTPKQPEVQVAQLVDPPVIQVTPIKDDSSSSNDWIPYVVTGFAVVVVVVGLATVLSRKE